MVIFKKAYFTVELLYKDFIEGEQNMNWIKYMW